MRRTGALVGVLLAMWAAVLVPSAPPATAQAAEGGSLMIVMDASGSMLEDDGAGRTKLDGAKAALRSVVAGLPDGAVTGLLVYGHRTSSDPAAKAAGCQDTQVVVPPAPLDRARMTAAVDGYAARGYTPIGRALQGAVAALPTSGPRTVLLVSDGVDTCAPPDPCTVAAQLRGAGVDLRVQTVGFRVDAGARAQLECIARAAGGEYTDVTDAAGLSTRLVDIATRAARTYQAQGSPVRGGASYQDAPVLAPGTYTDSLVKKETTWYGVDLKAGQELTLRSTLVVNGAEGVGVGSSFVAQIVGPDFEDLCCKQERAYKVNFKESPTVLARSGVVGGPGSNAEEPGRYYVRLDADGIGTNELPVEVVVGVDEPGAGASTSAAPPPLAAPPATGGNSLTPILLGVIGVLAALVIGLGITVAVLLRRPRRS